MNKSNIFELQGIVSVALNDRTSESGVCDPKEYAIFTNVSPFTDWIRQKAAEEEWKFIEMECEFK